MGSFLQSPDNFSGPKSNIQIEIKRIRARVLACKILQNVSLNHVETFILHVNNNSFTGQLIIGTWRNGPLARNDWKGTQTTKRHFCSLEHFFLSEPFPYLLSKVPRSLSETFSVMCLNI